MPNYQNKKTKIDYLLSCIAEESGEITQAYGKIARFGLFDVDPKFPDKCNNWDQLKQEVSDLNNAYTMLCYELGEEDTLIPAETSKKFKKLMEHSIKQGILEEGIY